MVAVEFDREQYSEIVYDKNQIPIVAVHYDELGRPIQWQPSQNITPVQLKYDKFGRLERWERGALSEHYSFDINGRLADVRFSDNSGFMYKYDDSPAALVSSILQFFFSVCKTMFKPHLTVIHVLFFKLS